MNRIWKRLTAAVGACVLALTCTALPAGASVDNGSSYPVKTNKIEGWPQMGPISSETAVLMDADTGVVLCAKGMNKTRYPASITKVMTTLLALENSQPSDQVTFTEEGLARMWEGTNIASQVGETLTMDQCLHIIMMVSANEVAAQTAIQVGGSEAAFAQMMNDRAKQIGCKHTHFNNASGLPDENHFTTAYDMALIFREALKNESFREIISAREYTLPPTNLNPETRTYATHVAFLLPTAPEYYPKCIGGKTGVTQAALHTLVTAAQKDGRTLIAVTMRGDSAQTYADSRALYQYGFQKFRNIQVEGGLVTVPSDTETEDLTVETEEQAAGFLNRYYLGGHFVGSGVSAESAEAVPEEEEEEEGFLPGLDVTPMENNPMLEHKGFAITAGAVAGLAVFAVFLLIIKLFRLIGRAGKK